LHPQSVREETQNTMTLTLEKPGIAHGSQAFAAGKFLSFYLSKEEYGIAILKVREIIGMVDVTPLPRTPEFVKGVINLRGKIIPVVDLRKRFGLEAKDATPENRIVVVEVSGRVIGFMVDKVNEVLRVPGSIVEPPPPMVCGIDSEYVQSVGKLEDRLLILLDLGRLFSSAEIGGLDNLTAAA